ncbi:MAG: lamin tail domain-containing protein [Gemmatimonadota bacterium]|nr:lamin tail domain-containing protein [Gemmatimonadota bacterium]
MRPFIALVFFALAAPLSAQPGPVVISELMWSGSTASSADEWIELYNPSDSEVDLAGWTLTYRSGTEDKVMLVLDAGAIPAGQTFLIANYAADHKNSLLAIQPQRVDAAVSLPNTKLLLHLYDGDPQAGGQLIDVADDGRGAPFAGDSASKSAMVRIAFDQPGDQAESWATATEQSGWDSGASELGTPGSIPAYLLPKGGEAPEPVMGTNVLPMSWASVKERLYP